MNMNLDIGSLAMAPFNLLAQRRARKDHLAAQRWQQEYQTNQAQIRRDDLERAGLHPTLMAGGSVQAGTPGASSYNPVPQTVGMSADPIQIAGTMADISRTLADKARIEKETGVIDVRLEHEARNVAVNEARQLTEAALAGSQVGLNRVNAWMNWLEANYMHTHHERMPTRNNLIAELSAMALKMFGQETLDSAVKVAPNFLDNLADALMDPLKARKDKAVADIEEIFKVTRQIELMEGRRPDPSKEVRKRSKNIR